MMVVLPILVQALFLHISSSEPSFERPIVSRAWKAQSPVTSVPESVMNNPKSGDYHLDID